MNKLTVILGILTLASTFGWAGEWNENFESYDAGQQISGTNGWEACVYGAWFQANATGTGDPSCLGDRYADLSNNDQGTKEENAWLFHSFDASTAGFVEIQFDARFNAVGEGGLDTCKIHLCDSDRTPDTNSTLQAVGISADTTGLRIHDGGWREVDDSSEIQNDVWYHFWIDVDLDVQSWRLDIAAYSGDSLGAPTAVSWDNGDTIFAFRDSNVNDLGLIEFLATADVMNDDNDEPRGFHVDNISVPEPAGLAILSLAAGMALRRKKP